MIVRLRCCMFSSCLSPFGLRRRGSLTLTSRSDHASREYSMSLFLEASLVAALVLLRLGYFRRASMVHLAGIWIWATLIFIFLRRHSQPGSGALRDDANLGGLAPRIQGRDMDGGGRAWLPHWSLRFWR